MPEIGTVGLSEEEAQKKGLEIDTASVNFRVLGKAHAIDEIAGEAKMIVENLRAGSWECISSVPMPPT